MHTAFGCGNLVSYSCWKAGMRTMLVCVGRRWKVSIAIDRPILLWPFIMGENWLEFA